MIPHSLRRNATGGSGNRVPLATRTQAIGDGETVFAFHRKSRVGAVYLSIGAFRDWSPATPTVRSSTSGARSRTATSDAPARPAGHLAAAVTRSHGRRATPGLRLAPCAVHGALHAMSRGASEHDATGRAMQVSVSNNTGYVPYSVGTNRGASRQSSPRRRHRSIAHRSRACRLPPSTHAQTPEPAAGHRKRERCGCPRHALHPPG